MEFSKSVIKLLKGLTVGLKLYSITEIKSHAYKVCEVCEAGMQIFTYTGKQACVGRFPDRTDSRITSSIGKKSQGWSKLGVP